MLKGTLSSRGKPPNRFSSTRQPKSYWTGPRHHLRTDPSVRFDRKWVEDPESGCHVWRGATDSAGYGAFHNKPERKAHRYAWTRVHGPIPSGLMIDHMCRNRACVNPAHLRAVTPAVNGTENSISPCAKHAAKTVCPRCGGEYTPEGKGRRCRPCRQAQQRGRKRNAKRKAKEFERAYGGESRLKFVQSLPCAACGLVGFTENAHIAGGGMGRKANYDKTVPLCSFCHRRQHEWGAGTFAIRFNLDLRALAIATERAWLASLNGEE